ncbi:hypothetical protein BEN49_20880 [Hymenobacter coccineus]|uniref:Uncharacterized protein n=1 Tax=Hymenobacter coccineus TaxID=1908235 RepID=A0A1G1TJV3_9BACT|nr:hypothetical protein BEN49_20880 [Hymenobacter coccineus]
MGAQLGKFPLVGRLVAGGGLPVLVQLGQQLAAQLLVLGQGGRRGVAVGCVGGYVGRAQPLPQLPHLLPPETC